jgi:hypothetical protein
MDNKKHNTWKRSDGTVISLDEMNEYHLRNALRKSLETISKLEEQLNGKQNFINSVLTKPTH